MTAPGEYVQLNYASVRDLIPTMKPGQVLIYHTGSLAFDRTVGIMATTVNGVAKAIYEAYSRGEVTLVQRKLAQFTFEYVAIRKPLPPRNAAKAKGRGDTTRLLGSKNGRDKPPGRPKGAPTPALVEVSQTSLRDAAAAV